MRRAPIQSDRLNERGGGGGDLVVVIRRVRRGERANVVLGVFALQLEDAMGARAPTD